MRFDGQVRDGGKPHYIIEELQMMSVGELRGRIGRISNKHARHIAVGLWQQLTGCWRGLDAGLLRDGNSVAKALGWRPRALVALLEELRFTDFGQVIMEGPEGMDEYLEGLSPLLRLFLPPMRVRRSFDNAARLARFLEFYVDPQRRWPASVGNWLSLLGGVALGLATLYAGMLYMRSVHAAPPWLLAALALPPILLLITAGREFQAFFRRRMLALFISFTDEFMDDERMYDDPVIRDPGW